jgi:hypothetical protein
VAKRLLIRASSRALLASSFALAAFHGGFASAQTHILVQESQYAEWQARAVQPGVWQNMKADAIARTQSMTYSASTTGFGVKNYLLRDVASANALAYILDPANRSTYRNNLRNNLLAGLQDVTSSHNSSAWEYNVPQGSMLVDAILALDVIRYDAGLSAADRTNIESLLNTAVNQIVTSTWQPNGQTVRSLWGLYQGNSSSFSSWKNSHDAGLAAMFTDGGVVIAGPNYGAARLSDIQAQAKGLYQDVLEAKGYHQYYSNPQLTAGHEYLYGYSHSPFGRGLTFGDAVSYSRLFEVASNGYVDTPQILRANRFSADAGKYAAWQLRQTAQLASGPLNASGRLLSYATMTGPITDDAELAPSRIFDAYAGLIERRQSPDALYGGLLSLTASEAHSHKEVNAIALGAFGEHILRNAGYNGYGEGVGLATWSWINNRAESGNTVVINGVDHASKIGGGIAEGFTGTALEYARGDSGAALSNGKHLRDLLFVQPGDGVGGYWLVADHVTPNVAGQTVQAFWHPNAATLSTQSAGASYLSDVTVGPVNFGFNQVKLTTYLATPPQATQVKRTTLADRSYSFDADYLAVTYGTSTGSADPLTVFFPSDQSHAPGAMSRIAYGGYTGAAVTQGAVVDVALSSNGKALGTVGAASFRGQDVVYRQVGDDLSWYFVGSGRTFNDGATQRTGFQAAADVSIFLDDGAGKIISPGAVVTLYEPALASILLNNQPTTPTAQGAGWMTLFVPAGSYALNLIKHSPTADFVADGVIDGQDLLAWQRGFGIASGATVAMGDSDYDGDVDEVDLAMWRAAAGGGATSGVGQVPEPAALPLSVLCAVGTCRLARTRRQWARKRA